MNFCVWHVPTGILFKYYYTVSVTKPEPDTIITLVNCLKFANYTKERYTVCTHILYVKAVP